MDTLELIKLFHSTYMDMSPAFGINSQNGNEVLNPNSAGGELLRAVWEYILPKMIQSIRYCSDCEESDVGTLLCEECWRDRPSACSICENDSDELYCRECIKKLDSNIIDL